MENLKQQNFQIHDKTKPLDWQHMQLVFTSCAIFHAISYAFGEMHPAEFSRFKDLTNKRAMSFSDNLKKSETHVEFLNKIKANVENTVRLFDENDNVDMINQFVEFARKSDVIFFDLTKYSGDMPVLLHGDFWSNNTMFKFDVSISVFYYF